MEFVSNIKVDVRPTTLAKFSHRKRPTCVQHDASEAAHRAGVSMVLTVDANPAVTFVVEKVSAGDVLSEIEQKRKVVPVFCLTV